MKKLIASLVFLFALPILAFAQATIPQGGTGTTTFPSGWIVTGAGPLRLTAYPTTTVSCSGTVSCSPFTTIGASPFTITGSAAASSPVATSSAETSGRIPFWTSTAATPALLSGGVAGFTFDSANTKLAVTYASSTALTVSGGLYNDALTAGRIPFIGTNDIFTDSAALLWSSTESRLTATNASSTALTATTLYATNATLGVGTGLVITTSGVVSTIAGTTCTNQFLRAFTVSGGTCATVAAADVSLANLTATDTTLTFSGTYNGSTARTIGINLANPNTWTALQTINFGTSTAFTVSGQLGIPAAANPTIVNPNSGFGAIAVDSTTASSSIHWKDSSGIEQAIFASTSVSLMWATTTPSTVATDTLQIAGPIRKLSYTSIGCNSVGGTANIQLGNGTASSTMVTSSSGATATTYTFLTSNNSFTQGQVRYIAIGTYNANTVKTVTCTFGQLYDPN